VGFFYGLVVVFSRSFLYNDVIIAEIQFAIFVLPMSIIMQEVNQEMADRLQQGIDRCIVHFVRLYGKTLEIGPYVEFISTSLPELKAAREKDEKSMEQTFDNLVPKNVPKQKPTFPWPSKKIQTHVPIPLTNWSAEDSEGSVESHVKAVELKCKSTQMGEGVSVEDVAEMGEGVLVEDVADKVKDKQWIQMRLTALGAVESAAQATIQVAEDWKRIVAQVQSMVENLIESMGGELGAVSRKTAQVSEYIRIGARTDIMGSARVLLNKWCISDWDYPRGDEILFRYPGTIARLAIVSKPEQVLDMMMDAWMQDICGIWMVVVDEAINCSKFSVDRDLMDIKVQMMVIVQSITRVQRMIVAKRPYTEVAALLVYLRKYYEGLEDYLAANSERSHLIRVKTAFQKMDEKLDQFKQEALALAEALRELPLLG
jgi:hypothetical protein